MNNRYFLYALFVTIVATFGSWMSMIGDAKRPGGSSWSSGARGGGGGYGGGYSGGGGWSGGSGHK